MTKATIAGGAFATVLVLLAVAFGYRVLEQEVRPDEFATRSITLAATETHPAPETHQGFLVLHYLLTFTAAILLKFRT